MSVAIGFAAAVLVTLSALFDKWHRVPNGMVRLTVLVVAVISSLITYLSTGMTFVVDLVPIAAITLCLWY